MKKIVSSILATSFVVASCAMNVMAAERTLSVSATPESDLEAGDKVVVKVVIGNDDGLSSCSYELKFDTNAFSVDSSINDEFTTEAPNFCDYDWWEDECFSGGWKAFTGVMGYKEGSINFAAAQSGAIKSTRATDNKVVGKYTLTVKEGVTLKNATFSLENGALSTDGVTDSLTTVPCTVTFKQDEPDPDPKWDIAITEETAAAGGHKVWKIAPTKTGTPDDIDKFEITLKDAEENEITKKVKTEDLNTIMSSWNTGVVFHIGVQNVGGHENITAAWDIAAGDAAIVPTVTSLN